MTAGVPLPSASSVPIHWSLGLATPVPSEVAKTVVAASEPRLPRMVTVVVMRAGGVVEAVDGAGEVLAAGGGHGDLRRDGEAGRPAGRR